MKTLKRMIDRRDKRLYVLLGLLVIGSVVSVVMMGRALFGSADERPAHDGAPPAAFTISPTPTLIESDRLRDPRLPDEVYEQVLNTSQALTEQFANGVLNRAALTEAGMGDREAKRALREIELATAGLNDSGQVTVQPQIANTAADTTTVTASVNLTTTAGVSVPSTITYVFGAKDGKWVLQQLQLSTGVVVSG